jgi:hypothetical protein
VGRRPDLLLCSATRPSGPGHPVVDAAAVHARRCLTRPRLGCGRTPVLLRTAPSAYCALSMPMEILRPQYADGDTAPSVCRWRYCALSISMGCSILRHMLGPLAVLDTRIHGEWSSECIRRMFGSGYTGKDVQPRIHGKGCLAADTRADTRQSAGWQAKTAGI